MKPQTVLTALFLAMKVRQLIRDYPFYHVRL